MPEFAFRMTRAALDHPDWVRVAIRTSVEESDGDIVQDDWLQGGRGFVSWVKRG